VIINGCNNEMYVANKFAAHLKDCLINIEYDSFAKVTRVCVLALITMNSGRVPMSMMSLWSLLQDLGEACGPDDLGTQDLRHVHLLLFC